MNKELKEISICFENLDVINIPAENVATFVLEGITKTISKGWHSENTFEMLIADYTCLILRSEADIQFKCIDEGKIFQRILKFNDIVSLELIYSDGISEEIAVEWDDGEYSNGYQTSEITTDKHLVIVISNKYTAADKCEELRMQNDEFEKARQILKKNIGESI